MRIFSKGMIVTSALAAMIMAFGLVGYGEAPSASAPADNAPVVTTLEESAEPSAKTPAFETRTLEVESSSHRKVSAGTLEYSPKTKATLNTLEAHPDTQKPVIVQLGGISSESGSGVVTSC